MDDNMNISEQLKFNPVIENESKLKGAQSFIVGGMGGSHIAAGLIKISDPALEIFVHRDYGLPQISESRLNESLFIASSYSGNTEEVIDFAEKAFAENRQLAIVSTDGKLLNFAEENKIPFVKMPDLKLQPRNAVPLSMLSMLKLMGEDELISDVRQVTSSLSIDSARNDGELIADAIRDKIPVVYSSTINQPLAYSWKIKFNETAKIPSFCNVVPELNHNEMVGFDFSESNKSLSEKFHFIFLEDSSDHPKVLRRMEILKMLYQSRGFSVNSVQLKGMKPVEKIFNSLLTVDQAALSLAELYGVEPDKVEMIEEFKKLIA